MTGETNMKNESDFSNVLYEKINWIWVSYSNKFALVDKFFCFVYLSNNSGKNGCHLQPVHAFSKEFKNQRNFEFRSHILQLARYPAPA